jgi:stearoyl-CoA desaturase (delta-9 desaturase)
MIILAFFVLHWYLSLFCQTFFHHRYAAHQMFSMSRAWEKTFFVISFFFQGSSYLSAYSYGILHRMHHAYADTENDPHSPKYDASLFAMMWRTKLLFSSIKKREEPVEDRFTKNMPEWHSFDTIAGSWIMRILWGAAYVAFYISFATVWWVYPLLLIHFFMGPVHGVIINWFAHKYGYTNFKMADTSKNLLPVDFLMLGESYHNNHHKRASNPNFGYKWFEMDPIYGFIWLFDKLNIIRLNKEVA